MRKNENNNARIVGVIVEEFQFNHECIGEKFYTNKVEIKRKSGNTDVIPILVSERLVDISLNFVGFPVEIIGEFRSYNQNIGEQRKLILNLFCNEFNVLESELDDYNKIVIDGFICKTPMYRITPNKREVSDVLLAVHRAYGKSDYIPCICWGRNARFVEHLAVGTHCTIYGRIQSRDYVKRYEDGTEELKTAYEVSVSRMEVVDDGNSND